VQIICTQVNTRLSEIIAEKKISKNYDLTGLTKMLGEIMLTHSINRGKSIPFFAERYFRGKCIGMIAMIINNVFQ